MHQEHGVCGLDKPYVKNFGSGIWRGNLKDRISRAAARISRKACAIDVVPKQVLQLEGIGRFVCDLVVATVELGHAGNARHKNLCAIRQAVSCGCDDDRIGLGCSADGLCGIEDLSTVAVDTHHTIAKLEDVGVTRLELERHQARLCRAVLDLAQELCAWPARHTPMRVDNHVQQLGQAGPVLIQLGAALEARRYLASHKAR